MSASRRIDKTRTRRIRLLTITRRLQREMKRKPAQA